MLYFLTIKGYTHKKEDAARNMELTRRADLETTIKRFEKRLEISRFAVEWLYKLVEEREGKETATEKAAVQFSVVELLNQLKASPQSLFGRMEDLQLEDVEEALLYLSKIGALKLEGGFLVLYNAMDIKRIKDNKSRYKQEDYRMLNEFHHRELHGRLFRCGFLTLSLLHQLIQPLHGKTTDLQPFLKPFDSSLQVCPASKLHVTCSVLLLVRIPFYGKKIQQRADVLFLRRDNSVVHRIVVQLLAYAPDDDNRDYQPQRRVLQETDEPLHRLWRGQGYHGKQC